MNSKLDKFEQAIEDDIASWTTVSKNKSASIPETKFAEQNRCKNLSLCESFFDKLNLPVNKVIFAVRESP